MKIALYHNLPPGGALRFARETVQRSASVHQYDLYRIIDRTRPDEIPDRLSDRVTAVHDVFPRFRWDVLARSRSLALAARLAALWDAEREVAARIDAGSYDLCLVQGCRLTQAPSLLTRLHTPSLYFAQEPRRVMTDLAVRRATMATFRQPFQRILVAAGGSVVNRRDARSIGSATEVACNSLFTAESLFRAYGRDTTVIRLGVDMDVFRPTGHGKDNYVLSVGALDPIKGHATIVEALASIPARQRPELKIAYERAVPGQDRYLLELAETREVTVELHRAVTDSRLVELYSRARATMCTARLEPFGLTPLESISCGTPVVAINEGGFRETVQEGRNGVLVPPSPEGVAAGILAILNDPPADPDQIRSSIRDQTWDRTVDSLHKLYSHMYKTKRVTPFGFR